MESFLKHLNDQHQKIQFTMETEQGGILPFLDVLLTRKKDTYTDRYLNAMLHHHPAQIYSVAKTLISRSMRIAGKENLPSEKKDINISPRIKQFFKISNSESNKTM